MDGRNDRRRHLSPGNIMLRLHNSFLIHTHFNYEYGIDVCDVRVRATSPGSFCLKIVAR